MAACGDETWEEFEAHCERYLNAAFANPQQAPLPLNWEDLVNFINWDDIGEFKLCGGHDSRVSDIEILFPNKNSSEYFIEVKKRSAQCGQIIVESDDDGNFRVADTSKEYETADVEWTVEADDSSEVETISGENFDIDYYGMAVDNLLALMNESLEHIEGSPFDVETSKWDARRFADGEMSEIACELVKEHYRNKNVLFFITKVQSRTYAGDDGFILIPIDMLHNYVETWATYRYKGHGSSRVSSVQYKAEAERIFVNVIAQDYGLDFDECGIHFEFYDDTEGGYGYVIRVSREYADHFNCSAVYDMKDENGEMSSKYRYKLLKCAEIGDDVLFQIRQLSNESRPTVVLCMRVRDEVEPYYDAYYTEYQYASEDIMIGGEVREYYGEDFLG